MSDSKLAAWLCLKTAPDVGFQTLLRIVREYGSPEGFVGNSAHPLYDLTFLSPAAGKHLLSAQMPSNLKQISELCRHYRIAITTILDDDYPAALRQTYSPPPILYCRGDKTLLNASPSLGVVGTRRPTAYGREMTAKLIRPVAEAGVCIISGMAIGIDTMAHLTTLNAKGKTIAVLAHGLDQCYPPQNKELHADLIAKGLIVSEHEPGTKMERWNFPSRNRIVAGISQAVFIVEGAITSGALLTAKFALEYNREVFALPGNINNHNAQGPNHLIRNGAIPITSEDDLITYYGLKPCVKEQLSIFPELSEGERSIYEILSKEQRDITFDELMLISQFNFGQLSIALLNLELKSLIVKASGNSYIIR